MEHPDLIEGHSRFSDAGVFRLRSDLALVQTVDFFPPLVDDARDYGRIAAANSLSDVYAMGGTPATALQIAGFPSESLDLSVLGEIFAGGAEKVLEAGAVIVGGHTVVDVEIKYGLAVTGTIHPGRIVSNSGARAGDRLVLTKPLGMGAISTAIKLGRAPEDLVRRAVDVMSTLNREASERMVARGARGATDITGFGLLGHAAEMAAASDVTVRLDPERVPVFPGVLELARRGILSGGSRRNREYLAPVLLETSPVEPALRDILFDSETSGGLLIALPPPLAAELAAELRERGHEFAAEVGEVLERGEYRVELAPLRA